MTIPWALHVQPGAQAVREAYVLPAGEVALIEGDAKFSGGLTLRGTLYLSSSHPTTLEADWIAIESGGSLIAGASDCPLGSAGGNITAIIRLTDGTAHPTAGRKALALMSGGTLELHGSKGLTIPWTRLAATAASGTTILDLEADVASSGWAAGDSIAIASTDFDPYQTEKRTVVGVAGSQLTVTPALQFKHWGTVVEGVDERAEVSSVHGGAGRFRGLQRATPDCGLCAAE